MAEIAATFSPTGRVEDYPVSMVSTGTTFTFTTPPLSGLFVGIEVDVDGAQAPGAPYAIVIASKYGTDLLGGNGAAIPVATNTLRLPRAENAVDSSGALAGVWFNGILTGTVSGIISGDTARIVVRVLRV